MSQAVEVQRRVQAMQRQLAQQTGVRCELKRRPEPEAALFAPGWRSTTTSRLDFDAALHQAEQQHALATWIVGARHTDDFLDPAEWQ